MVCNCTICAHLYRYSNNTVILSYHYFMYFFMFCKESEKSVRLVTFVSNKIWYKTLSQQEFFLAKLHFCTRFGPSISNRTKNSVSVFSTKTTALYFGTALASAKKWSKVYFWVSWEHFLSQQSPSSFSSVMVQKHILSSEIYLTSLVPPSFYMYPS
jgi:hypothetical protein